MDDDGNFVLVDELREQREKLRAVVGVDEWVIDLITMACKRIEELETLQRHVSESVVVEYRRRNPHHRLDET